MTGAKARKMLQKCTTSVFKNMILVISDILHVGVSLYYRSLQDSYSSWL